MDSQLVSAYMRARQPFLTHYSLRESGPCIVVFCGIDGSRGLFVGCVVERGTFDSMIRRLRP